MSMGRDAGKGVLRMMGSLLEALGVNDGRSPLPLPSIDDADGIKAYAVEMQRRLEHGPIIEDDIEYEDVSDVVCPHDRGQGWN